MVMFINGSSYHRFFLAVTICSTQKFTKDKVDIEKFGELLSILEANQTAIMDFLPKQ